MWMKVDDQLHSHRKTRAVVRSHPDKRRDIAPMGLWVTAGSWAGQNNTNGWVPAEELDRWDDDWQTLVARLVAADYWWPEKRNDEDGFGFVDWAEWNTSKERQSADGRFGNHERWHVRRKMVKPGCEFCPKEPDSGDESAPDIGPDSGADRTGESETVALPDPNPSPSQTKNPSASADAERVGAASLTPSEQVEADFAEWYTIYPVKRDKGHALKSYRSARRKRGVTRELLLAALQQQLPELMAREPNRRPYPGTWLNGERWEDQTDHPDDDAGPATGWARPASMPSCPPELVDDAPGYATWLADWNAGKPVLDADGNTVTKELAS